SRELCGGTHVSATGEIGVFLLASEGAVAAGIRRIEAFTGEGAVREIQKEKDNLKGISAILKTTPDQLLARVEHLIGEQKVKERQIESLKARLATKQSEDLINTAKEIKGVRVISQEVPVANPKDLRDFGDHLRDKLGSGIIVLGARGDSKVFLLCRVTPDLADKYEAREIIKELSALVGGKGGGKKDMAEGGGPRTSELKNALSKVYDMIAEHPFG
ncbi:MAG: DHHA1 domain-containing protein, partial [Desulfatiglandales bacterium]